MALCERIKPMSLKQGCVSVRVSVCPIWAIAALERLTLSRSAADFDVQDADFVPIYYYDYYSVVLSLQAQAIY